MYPLTSSTSDLLILRSPIEREELSHPPLIFPYGNIMKKINHSKFNAQYKVEKPKMMNVTTSALD